MCQGKVMAHMLQRDLYIIGNAYLIRTDASPSQAATVFSSRGDSSNKGNGGQLMSRDMGIFRRGWPEKNCSNNMLSIVTYGYVLPFHHKPRLARQVCVISRDKDCQKDLAQSLSTKDAIEKVQYKKSLGFYSRLFPLPKQKWRLVIDFVSNHNTFLGIEKLKIQTPTQ